MQIELCEKPVDYPAEIGQLRDANDLLDDPAALNARMAEDGYLFIRGLLHRPDVQAARERIIAGIAAGEAMPTIAATPELMAVLESPALFAFFAGYFGEAALTFDNKWLRSVRAGGFTGLHYDNVYMGRGSKRLHTVWTPFGDIPMRQGTLAILVGSHREGFQRVQETYGMMDVDRDPIKGGGWYSRDPDEATTKFGGHWATSDVRMGDVIVITMFTMNCSTRNLTTDDRLSCDTRFQPASDPADERWYGPDRIGHTGPDCPPESRVSLDEMKLRWGI